ncbi:unnamed protein product, partial [Mesorhabditis spiculigera]
MRKEGKAFGLHFLQQPPMKYERGLNYTLPTIQSFDGTIADDEAAREYPCLLAWAAVATHYEFQYRDQRFNGGMDCRLPIEGDRRRLRQIKSIQLASPKGLVLLMAWREGFVHTLIGEKACWWYANTVHPSNTYQVHRHSSAVDLIYYPKDQIR